MKTFHFSLGNSNDGPVGFCARVQAKDINRAVEILQAALPEESVIQEESPGKDEEGIEYLTVYFNPKVVTWQSIDEEDEVEDDVPEEVK